MSKTVEEIIEEIDASILDMTIEDAEEFVGEIATHVDGVQAGLADDRANS